MSNTQSFVNALDADRVQSERNLGETEIAYYLPSRDNGVNDMYVWAFCIRGPAFSLFFQPSLLGTSIWALVLTILAVWRFRGCPWSGRFFVPDIRYWLLGQRCIRTMISVLCKQRDPSLSPFSLSSMEFISFSLAMITPGVQKTFYNLPNRIWNCVLRQRRVSLSHPSSFFTSHLNETLPRTHRQLSQRGKNTFKR